MKLDRYMIFYKSCLESLLLVVTAVHEDQGKAEESAEQSELSEIRVTFGRSECKSVNFCFDTALMMEGA